MERNKIKEEETNFLVSESKKNPELFTKETFIDSPDFLKKIGIFFGNQKELPTGYVKLWPQDFIVEEMSLFGETETVDFENLFNAKREFLAQDPTIYATLVKCKLPTFEATKDLANLLKIDPVNIRSAGIKDTDAVTSQLISIRGAKAEELEKISSPYYFLKNAYSGKGAIEIGSLVGNKFTILVRTDKNLDKEQFNKNLERIKKEGFYNFFYSQRFGSPRFINWFWGLLILNGEYKDAISSFLISEGQREIPYFKNIRKEIKKNLGNWDEIKKIISHFPIILQNEIAVVEYLQKNPSDFVGALKQIPKQVQLWIFGYTSLLFNRKISECILNGEPLPEKLPIALSNDQNDWLPYSDFLEEDKITSASTKNLAPFADIQLKKRDIKTREKVKVHKVAFVDEGVVISFSLSKGCYATTFLAQLFQLTTGVPPKNISEKVVDVKEVLGEKSIKDLIEKFKAVTFSKSEDIFGNKEE